MGQVYIDLRVSNAAELDPRLRPPGGPHSLVLRDILMDTGATTLCLPAKTIEELGLLFLREVPLDTALGASKARIFGFGFVQYEDRQTVSECVELPDTARALLGAIPMEGMGIEPDLKNRRVRKLPLEMSNSFMRA